MKAYYSLTPFTDTDVSVKPSFDDPFYSSSKYNTFVDTYNKLVSSNNIQSNALHKTIGIWEGSHEPSVTTKISGNRKDIEKVAAALRELFNQDAVRVVYKPGNETHLRYRFSAANKDPMFVIQELVEAGVPGAQLSTTHIIVDSFTPLRESTLTKLNTLYGEPKVSRCEVVRITR